jgi:hypothetical protein
LSEYGHRAGCASGRVVEPPVRFEVYCDESRPDLFASRKSSDRFLTIGSLWLRVDDRERLKEQLHELRNRHSIGGEFKWSKISPSRAAFYRELIGWFFDQGDRLRFRCIAVDRSQVNLELYHEDDQELGFYKFYYQLLHHWVLDFNDYQVFVDFKANRRSDRLQTLRNCLANSNLSARVQRVQAVRSEESVLIQAVDVLTGAVSRRLNGPQGVSRSKAGVVAQVEKALGHEIRATGRYETKFNVFVIDLRGGW